MNGLQTFFEIRAYTVKFVYKTNSRNFIIIGIPPIRFRLRLHPRDSVENDNRSVQNAQRSFHFHSEINMSGSVNYVYAVLLVLRVRRIFINVCGRPKTSRRGGCNRDSAFAFLFHPIHYRLSFMHLSYLVRNTCIKKYPLGCSRLPGVYVRDYADISYFFYWIFSGHKCKLMVYKKHIDAGKGSGKREFSRSGNTKTARC